MTPMPASTPSIIDVGRKAKVHPSTVSRILNQSFENHQYAPKTIAKVMAVAREMGYRPSQAGRSLRTGKTMQIGVLIPDITSVFFSRFIKCLEKYVWETGYRLLICCSNENAQQEQKYINDLLSRGIEGLIVAPSDPKNYQQTIKANMPMVSIDRPLGVKQVPHVGLDNLEAGRMIGEHLVAKGYHHVVAVSPHLPNDPTLPLRCKGLAEVLDKHEVTLQTLQIGGRATDVPLTDSESSQMIHEATALPRTAVVGLTEDMTFNVYECLRSRGLSIPDDVGVGGIDDFPAARLVCPGITVVSQPIKLLAHKSFERLMQMIENPKEAVDAALACCELSPLLTPRQSL